MEITRHYAAHTAACGIDIDGIFDACHCVTVSLRVILLLFRHKHYTAYAFCSSMLFSRIYTCTTLRLLFRVSVVIIPHSPFSMSSCSITARVLVYSCSRYCILRTAFRTSHSCFRHRFTTTRCISHCALLCHVLDIFQVRTRVFCILHTYRCILAA